MTQSGFFEQYLSVKTLTDRFHYFTSKCKGKKILHVGCTDYPLEINSHSLHYRLKTICKELHGMDIDKNGIEAYKKIIPGDYFTSLKEVIVSKIKYDVILVPETIEHVDNVALFLDELSQISASEIIVTAPSATKTHQKGGWKFVTDDLWFEQVHPDHNCWYTPYTLKNVIQKYVKNSSIHEIVFLHDQHQVGVSFTTRNEG